MRVGIVGCGGHRTGGWGHPPLRRVTIDFVGAAVPSGPSITGAPPWSPSSVMAAPCHLLPCGAKAMGRAILAFPLPGGRCPRRGRMRVSLVGCIRPRRAAEDSGPYGQGSSHSVGADVPIRPESPESPAPWLPLWGSWHGAAVTERAARKKIKKTLDGQGLGVV